MYQSCSLGFQLIPALWLTWGFPRWKGSGHGSSHLLQEPRSAPGQDSCWRRAAAGGGTGPAGNASSGPATRKRAVRWATRDSAVTHHTSLHQPLLTTCYCLATTTRNAEAGAKLSTGTAPAQGLSSLSAFPQGRNSLESLSCQPRVSCPDQTHLQTLPLQPCALVLDHPSFAVELPVAFSRCLSAKLIPGSA